MISRRTAIAAPRCSTSCSASATVSRDLQFRSSYTVVEHAPEESIELEIQRHALEQIEKLQAAARDGDFTELFRLLGTWEAERAIEGDGGPAPEYTSVENTVVEAVIETVQARRPPATWRNIPSSTSNCNACCPSGITWAYWV